MEQLLKITNIPIAFEMNIQHAKLEYKHGSADIEISRDKGGLRIKSSPIKLNLDTFEARDSIRRYAQQGKTAAYEATATYSSEGHLLLNAKFGDDVLGQIIKNHTDQFMGMDDIGIDFIPKGGVEITPSGGDLTIDYQLDKMNFDWQVQKGTFEFIPGDIEISISQMPDVRIEYIGEPLYVPPSAAPGYEPIDVKA